MVSFRTSIALTLLVAACGSADGDEPPPGNPPSSAFRGTLTLAREGPAELFSPTNVIDYDLATGQEVHRFDGFDADRAPEGETAYITRLGAGIFADAGIVVADKRGVTEAPIYVCPMFNHTSNRICGTPRLAPGGRQVAFAIVGGDGKLCKDNYGMFWGSYAVVRDRKGAELARFEGYYNPEWLPDGRLLMLGSACVGAGVWVSDRALGPPVRVDGNQIATPAGAPAVSPDGKRLALVWNGQLWSLSLDGRHELEQLTKSPKPVFSAAWSPDGKAIAALLYDVSLPVRAIWLFRPGDEKSQEVRQVPFYPYGPISWR